jgi:hypothetical protein
MTTPETTGQDNTGDSGERPDTRVIDKARVLAHLQQQLAELAKEAEADNGDA